MLDCVIVFRVQLQRTLEVLNGGCLVAGRFVAFGQAVIRVPTVGLKANVQFEDLERVVLSLYP